jgi:hypothetical protein
MTVEAGRDASTLNVTGAVNNGGGLIRLTIAAGHGIPTGEHWCVRVDDVGGVPNATGDWIVNTPDSTHVDLQASTWGGSYTSGGTMYRHACGIHIIAGNDNANAYPSGFMPGNLLSGTWDTTFNRLTFEATCSKNFTRKSNYDDTETFGTYVKRTDEGTTSQGTHYYNMWNRNGYTGRTARLMVTSQPQSVNVFNSYYWTNDPEWQQPSTGGTAKHQAHYFDGMTEWYITMGGPQSGTGGWWNFSCTYDNFVVQKVTGEADTWVANPALTYNGTAYEVVWWGMRWLNPGPSYEARYSTTQSVKTLGWSNATSGGTVTGPTSSPYAGMIWTSPSMAAGNLWVAIRPTMRVWSMTGTGVSPIIVTPKQGHDLATGDEVTVAGAGGNTAANGTWDVTNVGPYLWVRTDNSLVNAVISSNVATVNVDSVQGLKPGMLVRIWGASGGTNCSNLNRQDEVQYTVQSVPNSTSFTINTSGVPDQTCTSGIRAASFPAISLDGSTANGNWTSGGTIVATDENKNFTEIATSSSPQASGPSRTFQTRTGSRWREATASAAAFAPLIVVMQGTR